LTVALAVSGVRAVPLRDAVPVAVFLKSRGHIGAGGQVGSRCSDRGPDREARRHGAAAKTADAGLGVR